MNLGPALAAGTVVLDGGLSTELERRGYDVSGRLWSARLLADEPDAIRRVHADFLRAGARVLSTASYQAGVPGLLRAGFSRDDAAGLLRLSVTLAREAVSDAGLDGAAWVAGSVGPYGAMLADGSEYTGAYAASVGLAGLRDFHRERMQLLAAAGADVLACETVPCVLEARALVELLAELDVPGWLSLTTVTTPPTSAAIKESRSAEVLTRLGEPAADAYALARDVPQVVAVGVNCTDPESVPDTVRVATAASGKPVLAYPNSGETWDAGARTWRGDPGLDASAVHRWLDGGARGVGGCCRVGPDTIAGLVAAVHG